MFGYPEDERTLPSGSRHIVGQPDEPTRPQLPTVPERRGDAADPGNDGDDEDDEDDGGSFDVGSIGRHAQQTVPMRVLKPLKANITDIPPEVIERARMVEASTVAYKDGFDAAQQYLDDQGIPYSIDRLHSTPESLVLLGDGDLKIAYRGTDIKNVSDVSADALIAAGGEGIHPQFTSAEEQLRAVTDMYGKPSELLGYSLGGAKAMTLGAANGIEQTAFNPFLGKNLLTTPKTDATTNIYRTTTDIASVGVGLGNHSNPAINRALGGKKNWNVFSIDPHHDAINPVESHELRNFTQVSERRPGATEAIMQRVVDQGTRTGEMELIHSMRIAQERGDSFSQFVREFSPADADATGLKGTRMTTDSKWVRLWEETVTSGGATSRPIFTQQEKYYFDNVGSSEKQLRLASRAEQRKAFAAMSEPMRVAALADEHVRMGEVVEAANAHTEMHASSVNALKVALHPTNVGTGLAASWATDAIVEHFDPGHSIPEIPREAVEGAAAGVVTEGVGAALGTAATGAALGPVAAGGAVGSVVGAQTSKAIYKGLKDIGTDDTVAGVSAAAGGGAAGGAAMVATTAGAAFAWDAAFAAAGAGAVAGTEVGAVGGGGFFDWLTIPVGAAIGTVVGVGSYAIGKL